MLTGYTISAHWVAANHVMGTGSDLYYPNAGGPTLLFPFPKSEVHLPVVTELSSVEVFIYQYLIRTYLLAAINVALWLFAGIQVFEKRLKK